MRRVCLIVMDSLGIGGAPDAALFGDEGADTLGHIAQACANGQANSGRSGVLRLPNLSSLGLGLAAAMSSGRVPLGLEPVGRIAAKYGCARPVSRGKDTPSGHFEMTGVPVNFEWGYFTPAVDSIPQELLARLVDEAELPGILGNCKASGTDILARLGCEHIATGRPIVYTSADSVLQIAAHEEHFGLNRLHEVCRIARRLVDEYRIARVIARPFVGEDAGSFIRTGKRRDYASPAPGDTVLDLVTKEGGQVLCVGKVGDIFAHRGLTHSVRASGHDQLMDATLAAIVDAPEKSVVMTNFVDFDSIHGHRRDVAGYACALEHFDGRLPELLHRIGPGDMCILTADHGCDPTWVGTDHTREQVPVLVYGPEIMPGNIGLRSSLADIGASVAHFFNVTGTGHGTSFLQDNECPHCISKDSK